MTLEKYFESPNRLHKTQEELARDLGVSQSYVSQLVARKKRPSGEVARLIVHHTGEAVTFDDLFPLPELPTTPEPTSEQKEVQCG